MTSVNFHLRPSSKKGVNEGSVFIRIIHNRKVKDITMDTGFFRTSGTKSDTE